MAVNLTKPTEMALISALKLAIEKPEFKSKLRGYCLTQNYEL